MAIAKEYEELCQKIWLMKNDFYREHRIKPNAVYVGHDEFYSLKIGNELMVNIQQDSTKLTIFGMKLKRVTDDKYISIGYVVE